MNTSQDSINEHFDNYRDDIKSFKSSGKESRSLSKANFRRRKKTSDWNARLRGLNKALREKLK